MIDAVDYQQQLPTSPSDRPPLMLSVTPEISWKLQLYFIGLKREDHASASAESLRKEIAVMEDKLNTKEELTKKPHKVYPRITN
ncbi:hypothetical protein F2Q69_00048869 [Brassica cretica]|uniref:Uncharacterized protein n=1 Tax=Brassica cretica TaxID=69181 RepID=A0A8S9PFK1_BRACR|nr:hypothetical protein F2Q69_00048869 [Brassica cretica]